MTGRRAVTGFVLVGVWGVVVASVLGRIGPAVAPFPFDLFSHYRLQYAGLLVIAVLVLVGVRHWRIGAAVAVLLAAHLVPLAPLVLPADQPTGPGTPLRVVQFNVLYRSSAFDDAASWLVETEADVIVVQEVTPQWEAELDDRLEGWTRLDTDTARIDSFGIAVYLRGGLEPSTVFVDNADDLPAIGLTLPTGDDKVLIYAVHTLPPVSPDAMEIATEQVDTARRRVAEHPDAAIVIGDLNATRWSALLRPVLADGELRDSAEGHGLVGTWPSPLAVTGMIGIDHVLVTDEIRVDDRWVGPGLGSDHRPVVADLVITEPGG